jgi:two-component system chemotaxis response regulator CheB
MLSGIRTSGALPERVDAVVVGASAGAVDALIALLPGIARPGAAPIIVVVHLSPHGKSALPQLLARYCEVPVREAEDKQAVTAGRVWIAPPDYHLLVERGRSFALSVDEPVRFSRPSIDVLFESAADAYGPALAGVVLTGANDDGMQGARAIRRAGGVLAVQDPASAEAPRMPAAAIFAAAPHFVGSIAEIAHFLRPLMQVPP